MPLYWFDLPFEMRDAVLEQLFKSFKSIPVQCAVKLSPLTNDATVCKWSKKCDTCRTYIEPLKLVNKAFRHEVWDACLRYATIIFDSTETGPVCEHWTAKQKPRYIEAVTSYRRDSRKSWIGALRDLYVGEHCMLQSLVLSEVWNPSAIADWATERYNLATVLRVGSQFAKVIRVDFHNSRTTSLSSRCTLFIETGSTIIKGLLRQYVDDVFETAKQLGILKKDRPLRLVHTWPRGGGIRTLEYAGGRWSSTDL